MDMADAEDGLTNSNTETKAAEFRRDIDKFLESGDPETKNSKASIVNDVPPESTIQVIFIRPIVCPTSCRTHPAVYICDKKILEDFQSVIEGKPERAVYDEEKKAIFVNNVPLTYNYRDCFNPLLALLNNLHDVSDASINRLYRARYLLFWIHYLQLEKRLPKLETFCATTIIHSLNRDSCVEIIYALDKFFSNFSSERFDHSQAMVSLGWNVKRIYDACFNVCLWNFQKLAPLKDFTLLNPEFLKRLLSHDMLNVKDEDQVVSAIMLWCRSRPAWNDKVRAALTEHGVRRGKKGPFHYLLTEGNLVPKPFCGTNTDPRVNANTIIILGGEMMVRGIRSGIRDVLFLDPVEKELKLLTQLPDKNDKALIGFSACVVENQIWISGGCHNFSDDWNRNLYIYNTLTGEWKARENALFGNNSRRHHGSCSDGHCLFIVGGFGRYRQKMATVLVLRLTQTDPPHPTQVPVIPNLPVPVLRPQTYIHDNVLHVFNDQQLYCHFPSEKVWCRMSFDFIGLTRFASCSDIIRVKDEYIMQLGVLNSNLKTVNAVVIERPKLRILIRPLPIRSDLLHVDYDCYRVFGGMTPDQTYEFSIYKSSMADDNETLICGRRDWPDENPCAVNGSHCSVVAPVILSNSELRKSRAQDINDLQFEDGIADEDLCKVEFAAE